MKEATQKSNAQTPATSEGWKAQRDANFKSVLREWMIDTEGTIHIAANDAK